MKNVFVMQTYYITFAFYKMCIHENIKDEL